jgi:hypothetical protein
MIAPFHYYGTVEMATESERLIDRHREPQSITLSRQSADKHAFKAGTFLDEYPTMPIVERERLQDGPVFQFRLALEGIEDPDQIFIETDLVQSQPEEGWDEVTRTVFTRQPKHQWFQKGAQIIDAYTGQVVPDMKYLWVMDRQERPARAATYFEVGMALRGLIGDKPFKRRINGTPQTVAPGVFEGVTIISAPTYSGFPPVEGPPTGISGADLDIEYDIPQISITDVFVTTTPPPTDKFPGFWSPTDPPLVFVFPMYGLTYTWHLPWGWKVTNLQSEQLAGQQLWIIALTWGYQRANTPKAPLPVITT